MVVRLQHNRRASLACQNESVTTSQISFKGEELRDTDITGKYLTKCYCVANSEGIFHKGNCIESGYISAATNILCCEFFSREELRSQARFLD